MQPIRNRHSRANGWEMRTIIWWHHRGSDQSASMMQQCGVSTPPVGWCDLRDSLFFLDTLQFSFFLGVSFEYHNTDELRKTFFIIKFKKLYYFLMSSSAAMKRLILKVMELNDHTNMHTYLHA